MLRILLIIVALVACAHSLSLSSISKVSLTPIKNGAIAGSAIQSETLFKKEFLPLAPKTVIFAVRRPG